MELLEGVGDEVVIFTATASITVIIISSLWVLLPSFQGTNDQVTASSSQETSETHDAHVRPSENESATVPNDVDMPCGRPTQDVSAQSSNNKVPQTERSSNLQSNSMEASTSGASEGAKAQENSAQKIRQQRLRFFEHHQGDIPVPNDSDQSDNEDQPEAHESENQYNDTGSSGPPPEEPLPDNAFRIRLKYLNDTERVVYVVRGEEVKDFKRRNFPQEVESGRVIHLIYNGQVLRPDDRSVNTFDLSENCVVHVHVAQGAPQQEPPQASSDSDLELGHLMWPLFACILGVIWMLHFQYRELFSPVSSVALTILTGLYAMVMWNHYNQQQQQQQ